jgi:hypothetical protein
MPAGRPTKYSEAYPEQARKLCLLGATDEEMADFFDVCVATITTWKHEHPEFLASIKSGKVEADAHLAEKLYSRAQGAEWEEEQAFKVKIGSHEEKVEIVTVKRAAPPDTTALIFWLKNRKPTRWRDRQEVDVNVNGLAATARDEDLAAIAFASGSVVSSPEDDKA